MNNFLNRVTRSVHLDSIRNKIFALFLVISILPLLTLTIINYINSVSVLKDEISKSNKILLAQTGENLDNILKTIEDKIWGIVILDMRNFNRYIGYLGKGIRNDPAQATEDVKIIIDVLQSFADSDKYIDSIYLYSSEENYLVTSKRNSKKVDNIEKYDWYKKAREADGKVVWMATRKAFAIDSNYDKQLISATLLVKDANGKEIGVLCVNIDNDIIKKLTSYINIGRTGHVLICDGTGNIMNHKDTNLISSNMKEESYIKTILSGNDGYFENTIDKEYCMITYYTSPYTNWKFAAIVPNKEIIYKIFWKSIYTILICLICIPMSIVFSLIISNSLYTPIKVLKKAMKKAANSDFSSRIDENRKDEFQELNVSFNVMVENIDTTIKELYKARLLKKEAELKALQSQINPHFLYNTLDSMYWMARLSKSEELGIMISSFSKFLKINLSKGREIITIKEIVEETEHYLTIQRFRFGDKFGIFIDVDEELYKYSMIKLLMQPLVENAIYHGLERKKGKGLIKIIGRKFDEFIKFSVIDDGIGMSFDRLQQIKEYIDNDMEDKNFALVNVNRRIKTIYGEQYKLNIESEEGKGTAVEILIPLIKYEVPGEEGSNNV